MFPIGIATDFIDLPEAIEAGYDFFEIPLTELCALSDDEFDEFAAWREARGIRIASVYRMLPPELPVVGDNVRAGALHDYLDRAFRRAHALGVKIAVLDAPASRTVNHDGDYPMAWRQMGNFLRLCQGHAKEHDITVVVEPLRKSERGLLNLVSEATLLTGILQLDHVAVCANTGVMGMASEPLNAPVQAGELLRHVRVENALDRCRPREGDGEDYNRLMRTLKRMGYKGGVCVSGTTPGSFNVSARAALLCISRAQRQEE